MSAWPATLTVIEAAAMAWLAASTRLYWIVAAAPVAAEPTDAVSASLNALHKAKDEAVSLEESFEEQVRARPLQSIGIALGVGFLAALLTRR